MRSYLFQYVPVIFNVSNLFLVSPRFSRTFLDFLADFLRRNAGAGSRGCVFVGGPGEPPPRSPDLRGGGFILFYLFYICVIIFCNFILFYYVIVFLLDCPLGD